jgi:D-alanyl-lipoteichoic acid acyltransferase DltB (MBOAT superfamily)
MSIPSLQFLIGLLLLSAVFVYLPGGQARRVVLAACNAGSLWLLIPNSSSWAALGMFLLSGYLMARLLQRWPSRILLFGYLTLLIVTFLILKKYEFVIVYLPKSVAVHTLSIVGLSYMLFRQIQVLVDASQGQIERLSLWSYANYQLNLFALLSGPIQRFQDFQGQWDTLGPILKTDQAVQVAHFRLLIGVVKMAVIGTAFLSLYQQSANSLLQPSSESLHPSLVATARDFLGILYLYPLYLYMNFSGYCDIVIAGASLVGIKFPENFDRPYLARNAIDFWTRWHRTLGFWIRDYLFLPLYKGVAQEWPERAESLAFLCYFVAFFVIGAWHGPTANFMIYGLLQAIGVSAVKLWERHILKRRGRAGLKQYLQSARVRALAIAATLNFECFTLLFFPVDVHTTVRMLQTVWGNLWR